MTDYNRLAGELLAAVRKTRPVVHSITNYVVMNSTANVLLAMGASPIMAHAAEEMEDLARITSSLVINIGTLSVPWIESMRQACRIAAKMGKPVVLDPVGSGATSMRTDTAREFVAETPPTVIRGNASEILSLSTQEGTTRGVDSIHAMEDAMESARMSARALKTVVAVTGERDLVTDGNRSLIVSGGSPLMGYVTGTGCAATVIVAAFLAVERDAVTASASALAFFKAAGERAATRSEAPGTFWVQVLDALYTITPQDLVSSARIIEA